MKKNIKRIGNVVTVLAILFVLRRILRMNWEGVASPRNLFVMILLIFVYGLTVAESYIPWKILVGLFTGKDGELRGSDRSFRLVYTKANLMKYIPGNVLQYVGRNEIAAVLDLDHVNVATATVAEALVMVASAALVSLVLIGPVTIQYIRGHFSQILLLLLGGLALLGLFLCVLYWKKKALLLRYAEQYRTLLRQKGTASKLLLCLGIYSLIFLWIGGLYLVFLWLCGGTVKELSALAAICGAFILSWLAGYITPGAPGGIGVRELLLTMVVSGSGIAEQDSVLLASACYRIMNTFGDMMAFLLAVLLKKMHGDDIGLKEGGIT